MAIRKIVFLPEAVLREVSKPVVHFDDKLHTLIDDMFETMYEAKGVGLAAPQIAVGLQLAVMDVVGDKAPENQIVMINPVITEMVGKCKYQEGCLSVPGAYDTVERAEFVSIKAQDKFGNFFEINQATGLLGECIQHEIDHLNGKLFIDLLSPLKRAIARKKLDKYKRQLKS